ncbi:MAG: methylated-DNA--[protein]-cysteine S-methyltransferase [Dictyoglomaceae bacterium]
MIGILPVRDGYLVVDFEGEIIKKIYWQREYIDAKGKFPYYELFKAYFNGEKVDFSEILLDFSNIPPFYKKVYETARKIPYGKVISYKMLSEKVGKSMEARAVGQAMAKNPYLLVIPCHRVIKNNGEIGNFSLGGDFKKWLLKIEGIEEAENGKILSFRYWWY